ncbi:MAG: hypothetical protein K2L64_02010, partial [Ureaplasma sp.]|nr:hypothetical protein [Ureaplasma sp.]
YNVVDLINIDNLNKAIQTEINKKSFTTIEFKDYLKTSSGLESIKYVISQKLDTSSDSKLNQSDISLVEFNGNNLEITLSSIEYTKYNMESLEYAILLDNKIILNNLDFFEEVIIKEYRMHQLWVAIQDLISKNGFSRIEFDVILRQNGIRNFLTNLVDMYLRPSSYNSIIDYKLYVIDSYYDNWNNELRIMFRAPGDYNIKIKVESSYLFRAEGNTLVFSNLLFLW